MSGWFRSARWVLMASLLIQIFGIVYFFQATYMFILIKFPFPGQDDCGGEGIKAMQNVYNDIMAIMLVGVLLPPFVLSFGHCKVLSYAMEDYSTDGAGLNKLERALLLTPRGEHTQRQAQVVTAPQRTLTGVCPCL